MNEITESRVTEINKLQGELNEIDLKVKEIGTQAVLKAQRIGQLLLEQKEICKNDTRVGFADWIENNCTFDSRTAERYINLYKYRDKIRIEGSFVSVYQQIAQIKADEKILIEEKAQERVKEYRDTGVKPDGWRRGTDDNILKQQIEEESTQGAFDIFGDEEESPLPWETPKEEEKSEGRKRFEELQQRQRAEEERQKKLAENASKMFDESQKKKEETSFNYEELKRRSEENEKKRAGFNNTLNEFMESQQKIEGWKDKIRLSSENRDDAFLNALMSYLDEIQTDNEKLAFLTDVIKVCKSIALDLQVKINKESV